MQEVSSWEVAVGEISVRVTGPAGASPAALRERALELLLDLEPEPAAAPAAARRLENDDTAPVLAVPRAPDVSWTTRLRTAESLGREAAALEAGGVAELVTPATDLRPRIWLLAQHPDGSRDSLPAFFHTKRDLEHALAQRRQQGINHDRSVWVGLPSKREAEAWIRGFQARMAQ